MMLRQTGRWRMEPRSVSRNRIIGLALCGVLAMAAASTARAEGNLNVLTWCDHEDPALLQPFEQANDVKVNFKDIDSTAAALAVLGQSKPGDWDVLVVDQTDTARLAGMNLLAPLDAKNFPFAD